MFKSLFLAFSLLATSALSAQDSLIVKSVYFGGGSYFIDQGQVDEVEEFLSQFERINEYEIILFSHTDNIGSKDYNKWLSKMRSQSVYRELVNIDIPKELIQIKNLGFDNPLYSNRTHTGRVKNRRVDIIISPIAF